MKTSRRYNRFEWVKGYLHISPSIIGFGIFVAYPLIMSIYYALTKWDGINKPEFVGFDNFNYLFTVDPVFWKALRVTFYYVLINVPASLIGGLALAMLLNKKLPFIRFFRTAFYLPTVLPMIATLTLWKFIYHPQYGLANRVLHLFGSPPVNWLSDERLALFSVILAGLWQIGGGMIIFLSGLQSIPQDLYEASGMDGARGWAVFRNVTLPLIAPILFLQLILGIIGSFQSFAQVQVMTGGGPNYATELLNFKIYADVFSSKMFGYGIAEVWILFLIIMLFTVITYRYSNQFVHYENDNR
ncbi:carbohydrate ABC transporter permease [Paenibacillus sacheonensis]|uniref:ABC transporter permease subunit n=1 Tax=Paenibacillus sacheonensis TaxID=742054 RepID=A0A7X5C288_9BACL|nr:sugar ABC transporter permease [Paenibacillus sacheonensis]MBM7565133.1 multiple sugar transport system permease protein [Paenibacillus sacheonensis]NBC70084.1 ABC transporter permease subunit [Paenibacillus sacheonensis]